MLDIVVFFAAMLMVMMNDSPVGVELIGVAYSAPVAAASSKSEMLPAWVGPFSLLNDGKPVFPTHPWCLAGAGEDPFLWKDRYASARASVSFVRISFTRGACALSISITSSTLCERAGVASSFLPMVCAQPA